MQDFLQSVPFAVILLLAGFVFLVKGADLFVEGSSSVAKRLKIPSIIIGLTIVAMGTSLPETAVSVTASIAGDNSLAVSNAVGSNIFNLMMVIGVCAVITPVTVQRATLVFDLPFSAFCAALLVGLGFAGMTLGRMDGILLLALFAGFLCGMIRHVLKVRKEGNAGPEAEGEEIRALPLPQCFLYIVIGIVGIKFGGDWVVDSASTIAGAFGIDQTLIGLTIVSIGTSLPELVTSVVAARKKEVDMALGNAIGSNIFNILMVLGVAAAISPIGFIMNNIIDIAVLLAFSVITWIFTLTSRKLNRAEGITMLILYAAYMVYICCRA